MSELIDMEALIALAHHVAGRLPGTPFYGHLAKSGLPTGFLTFRAEAQARAQQGRSDHAGR
jgi:hypothetical protein